MISSLIVSSIIVSSSCSWDNPGANRFTGDVPSAVHNYLDIPEAVRNKLSDRIKKRQFDDMAVIKKEEIVGKHEYLDLRDMHFGKNRICRTITREKWKANSIERGMVYCESGHCLIVPTVCGNLSRVTRLKTLEALPPTSGESGSIPPTGIEPIPDGNGIPKGFSVPPVVAIPPGPSFTDIVNPGPYGGGVPFPIWTPPPSYGGGYHHVPTPAIPEPSTFLLTILGLLAIVGITKNKR